MKKRVKNKICKIACTSKDYRRLSQALKKRYAIRTFKWQNGKYTHAMLWMEDLNSWYRMTKIVNGDIIVHGVVYPWEFEETPPCGNYNSSDLSKYQIYIKSARKPRNLQFRG